MELHPRGAEDHIDVEIVKISFPELQGDPHALELIGRFAELIARALVAGRDDRALFGKNFHQREVASPYPAESGALAADLFKEGFAVHKKFLLSDAPGVFAFFIIERSPPKSKADPGARKKKGGAPSVSGTRRPHGG